jgi:hypothetical protein
MPISSTKLASSAEGVPVLMADLPSTPHCTEHVVEPYRVDLNFFSFASFFRLSKFFTRSFTHGRGKDYIVLKI